MWCCRFYLGQTYEYKLIVTLSWIRFREANRAKKAEQEACFWVDKKLISTSRLCLNLAGMQW